MKFGRNLDDLSVPEWRAYNIDYNRAKQVVRQLTSDGGAHGAPGASDSDSDVALALAASAMALMAPLRALLLENFDYVNLFLYTKLGEIERKVYYLYQAYQNVLDQLSAGASGVLKLAGALPAPLVALVGGALETVALAAALVAPLTALGAALTAPRLLQLDAILYQLIPLLHTLSHLLKYLVLQRIATKKLFKKLVKHLRHRDQAQQFVAEMRDYALKPTPLFLTMDVAPLNYKVANFICELRGHQRAARARRRGSGAGERRLSIFTVDFSGVHPQQVPPTTECLFDLSVLLKKNFRLDFLVSDAAVLDLVLNMNVYLNCEPTQPAPRGRMSYTVLFDTPRRHPSFIISHEGAETLTLVTYTGGLRKYSYCILPTPILQKLLDYISGAGVEATKNDIYQYFVELKMLPLTRNTIDTMLAHNLVPQCRLVFTRQRFVMLSTPGHDDELADPLADLHDQISVASWQQYQDEYLMVLDTDVYTTNDAKQVHLLLFPDNVEDSWDRFPHNHLCIHTNDSLLQKFDALVSTEVKNGVVTLRWLELALRKLPGPVQNLVELTAVVLFRQLSFVTYMLLCYFNVVPASDDANNHYLRLLGLNLLKNAENVERFTNQLRQEHLIIKARLEMIIKRQLSQNNTHAGYYHTKLSLGLMGLVGSHTLTPSMFDNDDDYDTNGTDDLLEEAGPKDAYAMLLRVQLLQPLVWNQVVVRVLKWNHKWQPTTPPLLSEAEVLGGYGLVDEEEGFLGRNYVVEQFQHDYDQVYSHVYFSLSFLAIFVATIELGIVYLVFATLTPGQNLLLRENVGIVVVMVLGMLLSIIFLLAAINLSLLRFTRPRAFHQYVVWAAFTVVVNCCIWLAVILAPHV